MSQPRNKRRAPDDIPRQREPWEGHTMPSVLPGLLASLVGQKAIAASVAVGVIVSGGVAAETTGMGSAVREALGVEIGSPSGESGSANGQAGLDVQSQPVTLPPSASPGAGLDTAGDAISGARENAPDQADKGLDTAEGAIGDAKARLGELTPGQPPAAAASENSQTPEDAGPPADLPGEATGNAEPPTGPLAAD
jgi:hypothetical protein